MTDTNYNDGEWHIKPNNFCPVHPKSHVDTLCLNEGTGNTYRTRDAAEYIIWSHPEVIAFRVTKEHKEPREWWIVQSSHNRAVFGIRTSADFAALDMSEAGTEEVEIIHVREVIGDDT